jgi:hypothetical protein
VLAGIFLPQVMKGEAGKDLGASAAGALMYPVWQEVALRLLSPAAAGAAAEASSADLDVLAADLEDVMGEVGPSYY